MWLAHSTQYTHCPQYMWSVHVVSTYIRQVHSTYVCLVHSTYMWLVHSTQYTHFTQYMWLAVSTACIVSVLFLAATSSLYRHSHLYFKCKVTQCNTSTHAGVQMNTSARTEARIHIHAPVTNVRLHMWHKYTCGCQMNTSAPRRHGYTYTHLSKGHRPSKSVMPWIFNLFRLRKRGVQKMGWPTSQRDSVKPASK